MILNGSQITLFADDILLYREIKCPGDYAYVQSAVVGTFGPTWEYATFHVHQTSKSAAKQIGFSYTGIFTYS